MKLNIIILFLVTLSHHAFTKPPADKDIINLLNKVQEQTKSNGAINSNCASCQIENKASPASSDSPQICNDLYSATCLSKDGKQKFLKKSPTDEEKILLEIKVKARNAVAVLMGHKNFDEQLKSYLKEEGIELTEPLNQLEWKKLKEETPAKNASDDKDKSKPKELFSLNEQCKSTKDAFPASYNFDHDLEKISATSSQIDLALKKYEDYQISFQAKDIPSFLNTINYKCDALNEATYYKPEDNVEISKKCKGIAQIKIKAIELFRIEGTENYKSLSEDFIRKNLLPEFKSPSDYYGYGENVKPEELSEEQKLEKSYDEKTNRLNEECSQLEMAVNNNASQIYKKLSKEIFLSKPAVEMVLDSYYNESNKAESEQLFKEIVKDMIDVAGQFIKDPVIKNKIDHDYNKLALQYLKLPELNQYKKNEKGILVLDQEKFNQESPANPDLFSIFSDESLSYFSTQNAFFVPNISMGETQFQESITLMPAFLKNIHENRLSILTILAHEAGHKIDLNMSNFSKYGLDKEYKTLLACYKDRTSIRLQHGQEGEVIADYLSSEVIARNLMRMNPELRREALMSSVKPFCSFDSKRMTIDCLEEHPEPILRMSGIFGANPNIRKAVGCNIESSKYKSCGIESINLPTN